MATKATAPAADNPTTEAAPAATTTPVTVQVEGQVVNPAPLQGLEADAKAAQANNIKVDQQQADEHKELRDSDKLVAPTPLIGYEAARADLYVEPAEKTSPDPAAEELAK